MIKLEKKLLDLCQKNNFTFGFSESCTGGGMAARISAIPGASKSFLGSIVCYQDSVKEKLLGVPSALLLNPGAVSHVVAEKMLEGTLAQLSVDIAAATTGFAGPEGGLPTMPVGTVFIATGGKQFKHKIIRLQLEGERTEIIQKAIDHALLQLIACIENVKH